MRSYFSEDFGEEDDTAGPLTSLGRKPTTKSSYSMLSASTHASSHTPSRPTSSGVRNTSRAIPAPDPIITISSAATNHLKVRSDSHNGGDSSTSVGDDFDDEPDYVAVEHTEHSEPNQVIHRDKASRVLGIKHRRSMEPIPAPNRTSVASVRSAPAPDSTPAPSGPTLPLASLYVVSGLPKSPHTWTLADPDSVMGLHHSDGAVNRWWRPEVLGSTVSPGAGGGGKKKRRGKSEDTSTMFSSQAHLSKQEVGKMLSKALKVGLRVHVASC